MLAHVSPHTSTVVTWHDMENYISHVLSMKFSDGQKPASTRLQSAEGNRPPQFSNSAGSCSAPAHELAPKNSQLSSSVISTRLVKTSAAVAYAGLCAALGDTVRVIGVVRRIRMSSSAKRKATAKASLQPAKKQKASSAGPQQPCARLLVLQCAHALDVMELASH